MEKKQDNNLGEVDLEEEEPRNLEVLKERAHAIQED